MKPLLLDFSVAREESVAPIFSYDSELNLNTVLVDGIKVPFVDSNINAIELLTKTKVERESDDEERKLFELETKTEVNRERDDEEISLLELETKTFTEREKDDESISCMSELLTKTAQEREKDDDDFIFN